MTTIRRWFLVAILVTLPMPLEKAWAESASTVKMALSANENYLQRFRKERDLLATANDAASVQKRGALEKKIKNLEAESQRLEGQLRKGGAVLVSSPPPSALPATPVPAPTPAPLVGSAVADWEKMSREEKENYVISIVRALQKEGRTIERHPLFYTALMDYVFVSDAVLAAKPLRDAIVATIQKNEDSLKALQKS